MKELLAARGLNVDNWRYISFTPPDKLVIIHKHSLQPRLVKIKEVEVS